MQDEKRLRVVSQGEREIVIERAFQAEPELVWEALTRADLLQQWCLGPPGWTMTVCENDLQVGGAFRHVWRKADGSLMSMQGEYRELVPGQRFVRTETFDFGCDGQVGHQVATSTLIPASNHTVLRITIAYPSREARDATLRSGMEQGVAASYDRIDALLPSLR